MKGITRCGRRVAALLATAAAALLMTAPWAAGAPITFHTALPVSQGYLVARELLVWQRLDEDPTPADREVEVRAAVTAVGYGITGRLAAFGVVPLFDKHLRADMEGRRIEREVHGFGDAALFARYTLLRRDEPGATLRLAPFLGVEAPTGAHRKRDRFGRLPPSLQPGSGSWDPLAGAVLTRQTLDWQLDLQASYQNNTRAGGVERGDQAALDASLQYRLWPGELGGGVPHFLYGVAEANWRRQGRTELDGQDDPDTGGTVLFVTPGLQYVTRKWIAEGAVQLPVVDRPNGDGLAHEYTVLAGIRINL